MRTRYFGRLAASMLGVVLASLALPSAPAAQVQTDIQQKCIQTMNKHAKKMSSKQAKTITSCIKAAAKLKENKPDSCLVRDLKGRIGDAITKAEADYDEACAPTPPDFGVPLVPSEVAAVLLEDTIDSQLWLSHQIFGLPLSPALVTDKDDAKCQASISKESQKIAATYMKNFFKCEKDALKQGADDSTDLLACVLEDAGAKAAKAVSKLATRIGTTCTPDLFPGACSGKPIGELAECIHERVRCNMCLAQNDLAGLAADCDAADDSLGNGSCEVPVNFTVRRRIQRLAPAANIGHRGTGPTRVGHPHPENSLSSFAAAMADGADGIELDVELTSDGQLVVMHDDTLDRTTNCAGCVNAFTLAQVQACLLLDGDGIPTAEYPPTLAEVYAALPADALVNVELKVYGAGCVTPATTAEALAQAGVAEIKLLGVEDRTFFSSFSLAAATEVKTVDANLYSAHLFTIPDGSTLSNAVAAGLDAVHPNSVVLIGFVDPALAAGLQVNVWTVNTDFGAEQNIDKGVSAMITDNPALIKAVLEAIP